MTCCLLKDSITSSRLRYHLISPSVGRSAELDPHRLRSGLTDWWTAAADRTRETTAPPRRRAAVLRATAAASRGAQNTTTGLTSVINAV